MKFCGECGARVERRVPAGDNRERDVCPGCGAVHYENPKIVAGCIAEWEGRILLCRRAIEPRYGQWTLPAGFMENEETTQQAAMRETLEEASAEVEIADLYALFNLPHINQVYMLFRGHLREPRFAPGVESLDVALFDEGDVPWAQLAFPVVHECLRLFFADRRAGSYGSHLADIVPVPGQHGAYRARLCSRGERNQP